MAKVFRMHRLTREIRLNLPVTGPTGQDGSGHAGYPAADGPAVRWGVRVTLSGMPDVATGYLLDIKAMDDVVRRRLTGLLTDFARSGTTGLPGIARAAYAALADGWPGYGVDRVEIVASPQQSAAVTAGEPTVTRLSHRFEFSAAHRLHVPGLSDDANRQLFGKCNNAAGHGHNYEVEVTLAGTPDASGRLIGIAELERLVDEHAINKVDHKHLNHQVPEFADLNPSVENIAKVIYTWLKPVLRRDHARLKAVTVWETPKTSCEYAED
ncbi:MAG: 6-carboxytetrahydropterin synthase [Tepidisphaeraceae bacterium]